jgi:hypothetical protein
MSGVPLTGLRAENPMAFLAALGALSLASDGATGPVSLSWQETEDGSWAPLLDSDQVETSEQVVEAILAGNSKRDIEQELGWEKDLMRISRTEFRAILARQPLDEGGGGDGRAARMLAACLCELPARGDGSLVAYTPFRLIPRMGRTRFLDTAWRECEAGVGHLHACLFEPWRHARGIQSLRWDPGAGVPARAIMAQAPTHLGPSGVPGAVLLAVRGMAFFPLVTTHGGRTGRAPRAVPAGLVKRNHFVWPIWSEPLSERATRMLLSMPWLHTLCALREGQRERETDVATDRSPARKIEEERTRTYRQLRAHDVAVCYTAQRVRRGDDDEALGWGEPVVIPGNSDMQSTFFDN